MFWKRGRQQADGTYDPDSFNTSIRIPLTVTPEIAACALLHSGFKAAREGEEPVDAMSTPAEIEAFCASRTGDQVRDAVVLAVYSNGVEGMMLSVYESLGYQDSQIEAAQRGVARAGFNDDQLLRFFGEEAMA